ncbi:MAG: hypothetical protein GY816_10985 [Cytophagales bacterium]|nr:hypothetical protein [Cytophagales bacterium]
MTTILVRMVCMQCVTIGEGRVIITDRYSTGPNVVYPMAKAHNTFWCGTCNAATKSFVPKEIMKGSHLANSLARGETLWRYSSDGRKCSHLLQSVQQ